MHVQSNNGKRIYLLLFSQRKCKNIERSLKTEFGNGRFPAVPESLKEIGDSPPHRGVDADPTPTLHSLNAREKSRNAVDNQFGVRRGHQVEHLHQLESL